MPRLRTGEGVCISVRTLAAQRVEKLGRCDFRLDISIRIDDSHNTRDEGHDKFINVDTQLVPR